MYSCTTARQSSSDQLVSQIPTSTAIPAPVESSIFRDNQYVMDQYFQAPFSDCVLSISEWECTQKSENNEIFHIIYSYDKYLDVEIFQTDYFDPHGFDSDKIKRNIASTVAKINNGVISNELIEWIVEDGIEQALYNEKLSVAIYNGGIYAYLFVLDEYMSFIICGGDSCKNIDPFSFTYINDHSRESLGVSVESALKQFTERGFEFESNVLDDGRTIYFGDYYQGSLYLTESNRNLIKVQYTLDVVGAHDKTISPREIGTIALGEQIFNEKVKPWLDSEYQNPDVPWDRTHPIEWGQPLCFDGIVVHYYHSNIDLEKTINISIMIEKEWDSFFGDCTFFP